MTYTIFIPALLVLPFLSAAQPGSFSLGTRNTISFFNHDAATGTGIGGQFRIQPSRRLNTEWYFDYITSKNETITYRNDYHIGWSLLLYGKNNTDFTRLLQPYFIAGHCFDYSKVAEQNNKTNAASRLSMATQAGMGTHINITTRLDASLSAQYMLHFGKELTAETRENEVHIHTHTHSSPEGHLLFSVSLNYKFAKLWK